MLAEALTVEQVVQVISEVGRSAIGAERSAVAMLDTERLRLRTINPDGLPGSTGAPTTELPLSAPSVMTMPSAAAHTLANLPRAKRRMLSTALSAESGS